MEENQRRSAILLALTGANFLLTYALGVLLARQLGVDHFDEFAVAVALVTMLSSMEIACRTPARVGRPRRLERRW